jgi:hypothetical protein
MGELIVKMFIFVNGIVAAIGLRVLLSCNWEFGIFTQQKSAQIISETRKLFRSLRDRFSSKEDNQQPCSMLVTWHS